MVPAMITYHALTLGDRASGVNLLDRSSPFRLMVPETIESKGLIYGIFLGILHDMSLICLFIVEMDSTSRTPSFKEKVVVVD